MPMATTNTTTTTLFMIGMKPGILTAKLLSPHGLLVLGGHLQGGGFKVAHDLHKLLEADLSGAAHLAVILVPGSARELQVFTLVYDAQHFIKRCSISIALNPNDSLIRPNRPYIYDPP